MALTSINPSHAPREDVQMGEDEPDSSRREIAKVAFHLGLILCGLLFAYSEMPRSIKREITLQKIMRNLQKYSHSDTIPVVDHNERKGANVESSASRTARLSDAPALRPARSDSPPPKEAEKPASDEKPKRKLS